jgi:hypothetical protein
MRGRKWLTPIFSLLAALILAGCIPATSAPPPDPLAAYRGWIECTIDHESRNSGTYWTNTGNSYYGAFQFTFSTWAAAARDAGYPLLAGTPPVAPEIGPEYQDLVAVWLLVHSGPQHWGGRCTEHIP